MARAITERPDQDFMPVKLNPGATVEPITFWDQPAGTDLISSLNRLGPNKVPYSLNFRINEANRYEVRKGLTQMGAVAVDSVVGLVVASTRSGGDFHVRITQTTVSVSTGGAWTAYTGPALNIPSYVNVEFAAWGGKLMFTDQTSGLYEIDFSTKTYALIAAAPVGKHLTVFGGRVVLSNIDGEPTRVQWSVKNNNADWSGLGSGYDDMLSAPGGVIDVQKGIFPITDTEAFVVRTSSIWVMTLTGFSDAPFAFTYRFAQGTDASQSIVRLPSQALMMLGKDDVVVVTSSGIQEVGIPVRNQMVTDAYVPRNAIGVWDSRKMAYRIYIPPATPTAAQSSVWEFFMPTQAWSLSIYPFQITAMAAGGGQRALTIGELSGLIIDLDGPIGELGLLGRLSGVLFGTAAFRVLQESDTATTDVTNAGTTQPVPIDIWSGLVQPGGSLLRAQLLQMALEYVTGRSLSVSIYVSPDGGITWELYGTLALGSAIVPPIYGAHFPQIGVFRKTIEKRQYQFRIISADGAGLELIAAHAIGQRGAPVNL